MTEQQDTQQLLAVAYAEWCKQQGVENLAPTVLATLVGEYMTPKQLKWLDTFSDLFNQSEP